MALEQEQYISTKIFLSNKSHKSQIKKIKLVVGIKQYISLFIATKLDFLIDSYKIYATNPNFTFAIFLKRYHVDMIFTSCLQSW